jgi:histidinol phosphatase-like enzyme
MSVTDTMFVASDLDGTLVEPFKTVPLPGARLLCEFLAAKSIPLVICTNQAGPMWGVLTKQEKYPTPEMLATTLFQISSALKLSTMEVVWCLSINDPRFYQQPERWPPEQIEWSLYGIRERLQSSLWALQRGFGDRHTFHVHDMLEWRKPKPGMLLKAANLFGVPTNAGLFLGDMQEDQDAANAAGMPFLSIDKNNSVEQFADVQSMLLDQLTRQDEHPF